MDFGLDLALGSVSGGSDVEAAGWVLVVVVEDRRFRVTIANMFVWFLCVINFFCCTHHWHSTNPVVLKTDLIVDHSTSTEMNTVYIKRAFRQKERLQKYTETSQID